jgi:hypothetical protein
MASIDVNESPFRGCGQISVRHEQPKKVGNVGSGIDEEALDLRSLWPNGSTLTVKISG